MQQIHYAAPSPSYVIMGKQFIHLFIYLFIYLLVCLFIFIVTLMKPSVSQMIEWSLNN